MGPVQPALSSQDELAPDVDMCRRGQAWRSSSPYSYWLRISVGSAYQHTPRGGCCFWEGGGGTLLSTEFWVRNHAALEHIDLVVGHGRSGEPLSSTRLNQ